MKAVERVLEAMNGVVVGLTPEDLIPNKGQIIIRKAPPIKKHGNIHIPDNFQQEQCVGLVVAVHPECLLSVGDIVIFRRGAGVPLTFLGESEVLVIQYTGSESDDVLAIVRNSSEAWTHFRELFDRWSQGELEDTPVDEGVASVVQ